MGPSAPDFCHGFTMSDAVVAALCGAVLAGLAALLVQLSATFINNRTSERVARARGLAEYVASTHSGVIAMGLLALQPEGKKAEYRASPFYTAREDRETSALNVVQLLDPDSVVLACTRLHHALVALERDALARQWEEDEWRERRKSVDPWVEQVFEAGRQSLGRRATSRQALWDRALADVRTDRSVGRGARAPSDGA